MDFRRVLTVMAAVGAIALATAPAHAGNHWKFSVVNKSQTAAIEFRTQEDGEWSSNWIKDRIEPGDAFDMDFGTDKGDCTVRTEMPLHRRQLLRRRRRLLQCHQPLYPRGQADERLRPARRRLSTASARKRRSPFSFSAPLHRPLSRLRGEGARREADERVELGLDLGPDRGEPRGEDVRLHQTGRAALTRRSRRGRRCAWSSRTRR